ncbi:uncharacterized protein CLUP02_13902 [Colletotrichum lupini]|uniref:Uncharacterized protein n=1 Tax=Colletotrichum lupini TaxID=145971 RepID=A0A9Q8T310_9PEZI|nr:uncharacterized protein CLUP02_13902 [Colletotrichum lupini]UQC88379.1 hypothetical protein CLUP02_13902 [Colletotrichum lupini]
MSTSDDSITNTTFASCLKTRCHSNIQETRVPSPQSRVSYPEYYNRPTYMAQFSCYAFQASVPSEISKPHVDILHLNSFALYAPFAVAFANMEGFYENKEDRDWKEIDDDPQQVFDKIKLKLLGMHRLWWIPWIYTHIEKTIGPRSVTIGKARHEGDIMIGRERWEEEEEEEEEREELGKAHDFLQTRYRGGRVILYNACRPSEIHHHYRMLRDPTMTESHHLIYPLSNVRPSMTSVVIVPSSFQSPNPSVLNNHSCSTAHRLLSTSLESFRDIAEAKKSRRQNSIAPPVREFQRSTASPSKTKSSFPPSKIESTFPLFQGSLTVYKAHQSCQNGLRRSWNKLIRLHSAFFPSRLHGRGPGAQIPIPSSPPQTQANSQTHFFKKKCSHPGLYFIHIGGETCF